MKEQVNHPEHYGGSDNTYEVIKVIEAWKLGFHLGNTVKYIGRAGKKGDKDKLLEDLKKSRWYLDRKIEQLEGVKELKKDLKAIKEEIDGGNNKIIEPINEEKLDEWWESISKPEKDKLIKNNNIDRRVFGIIGIEPTQRYAVIVVMYKDWIKDTAVILTAEKLDEWWGGFHWDKKKEMVEDSNINMDIITNENDKSINRYCALTIMHNKLRQTKK